MYRRLRLLFSALLFFSFSLSVYSNDLSGAEIHEGFSSITVTALAPIPDELGNTTQGQAISREAAVGIAQIHLLNYVLTKRAHSGKILSEAEIPSIDLQQEIRGTVKGAAVVSTVFEAKECRVKLVLPKSRLKYILKKG